MSVYVCFQGFGEAVELPDSAGFLPEPGLCLQGAAGQHTLLIWSTKPACADVFILLWLIIVFQMN